MYRIAGKISISTRSIYGFSSCCRYNALIKQQEEEKKEFKKRRLVGSLIFRSEASGAASRMDQVAEVMLRTPVLTREQKKKPSRVDRERGKRFSTTSADYLPSASY
jgi:hypothetical protein